MVNPIPKFAEKIWSKWNIRGVILTSLSLQIFLILFAPLRKRTKNGIVVLLLWSTYLLADFTANFCVGLISNKYGDNKTAISDINDFVLAFWAPFLLLHLGGPDTITAFSLEDNELWLRHMLGLIVQVCLTGYVFLLTLPANTLWLPTALIFVAGITKFAERTRSLQLASISNFRQSMTREPEAGPNYAKLMEEFKSREDAGLPTKIVTMPEPADQPGIAKIESEEANKHEQQERGNDSDAELEDVNVVREAHRFFQMFKGLIVDMIFSFHERNESRDFFVQRKPVDALRVIEVELNFIYEAFYTKASVLRHWAGFIFRFVSVCSVVAALVLFDFHQKHGCNEFDVRVTYTLLFGAVALDAVSLMMLIFSDGTFAYFKTVENPPQQTPNKSIRGFRDSIFSCFLKLKRPKWLPDPNGKKTKKLSRHVLFRSWSGSISGFNLISYCQHKRRQPCVDKIVDYIGAREILEKWKYEEKHPLLLELWNFIFEELKRKSEDAEDVETVQRICSCRGAWVIQEGELSRSDIVRLMPYVNATEATFDQSLILWHIATDLLFYTNFDKKEDAYLQRCFSKHLSDYMLYLLIMQPTMMSAIRGIGQIRFQDTCAEATEFFSKRDIQMAKDEGRYPSHKFLGAIKSFSSWLVSMAPGKDTCKKLLEITKKFITRGNSTSVDREEERMDNNKQLKDACEKLMAVSTNLEPSAVKGDRSKSVLFDACRLAKNIQNLEGMNKWKIIAQVWVELLSFAASNCRPITHVQQLSKGGEFISLVWLLMTHLGLGSQFQIKEGHARAKLIVGEENKSD